ncbi:aspartate carbamoyltransferase [Alicyclobacillus hesperidum URH17-3-68]|uniref:Aspartate carbamoyltransferase n=1 Tax=Alicyclobacillus hesperidum TaxID=89784 RepID=A0A1H2UXG3_9BACL|nr:aspartate carbamoyltransferase [Alicyclobacillus hesperidum]EJY55823.1 aspartate carbamoyltransferase [Alicyclobacillus hesperidum URH17-3-68]GLV14595.1 aspartate carbamoyltransferase [Alicyclobacillus hesperidum]SDW60786.1 aspartate carbamoyltransferase [Alicyclobacillus hesperidum]
MFHALSIAQFDVDTTFQLIRRAEALRAMPRHETRALLAGDIVATLFYEPSTRTRLSFEAAVYRLGGQVVSAENARENSSSKKGESLADVFRVVGCYADAIVIRHHRAEELDAAAPFSPVPVINAGAGSGEHPTQALLDAYTIWRELGRLNDLTVAVLGDLKYGRTVHSLLRLLAKMEGIRIRLFHPEPLGLPPELAAEMRDSGIPIEIAEDLEDAVRGADIVYQTRIQAERLQAEHEMCATDDYAIRRSHLAVLPEHARILHPLPRVGEIDPAIDPDDRAAYFRQAENGLYMRMALLDHMLRGELG